MRMILTTLCGSCEDELKYTKNIVITKQLFFTLNKSAFKCLSVLHSKNFTGQMKKALWELHRESSQSGYI